MSTDLQSWQQTGRRSLNPGPGWGGIRRSRGYTFQKLHGEERAASHGGEGLCLPGGGCGRDEGPVAELPWMPRHLGRSCVGVSVSGFLQSLGRSLTEGLHLALRPRPVTGEVLGKTRGPPAVLLRCLLTRVISSALTHSPLPSPKLRPSPGAASPPCANLGGGRCTGGRGGRAAHQGSVHEGLFLNGKPDCPWTLSCTLLQLWLAAGALAAVRGVLGLESCTEAAQPTGQKGARDGGFTTSCVFLPPGGLLYEDPLCSRFQGLARAGPLLWHGTFFVSWKGAEPERGPRFVLGFRGGRRVLFLCGLCGLMRA